MDLCSRGVTKMTACFSSVPFLTNYFVKSSDFAGLFNSFGHLMGPTLYSLSYFFHLPSFLIVVDGVEALAIEVSRATMNSPILKGFRVLTTRCQIVFGKAKRALGWVLIVLYTAMTSWRLRGMSSFTNPVAKGLLDAVFYLYHLRGTL